MERSPSEVSRPLSVSPRPWRPLPDVPAGLLYSHPFFVLCRVVLLAEAQGSMLLALLIVATQDGLRRQMTAVVSLGRPGLGSLLKRKGDNGVSDSDSCDKHEFRKGAERVAEALVWERSPSSGLNPAHTLLGEHSRCSPSLAVISR